MHKIKAISRTSLDYFTHIPYSIARCNCFIFGGGSLLHDKTFYTLPIFFLRALFLKVFRKKFLICGQSVSQIDTIFGRIMLKCGLVLVDCVSVRDKYSSRYFSKIGYNTIIAPDLAFAGQLAYRGKPVTLKGKISPQRSPKIAITVRSSLYFKSTLLQHYESVMANMADYLIEHLAATIVFLPMFFQNRGSSNIDDLSVVHSIVRLMKNKQSAVILKTEDLNEFLDYFSEIDLLIGAPLHSLIIHKNG